MVLVVVGIWAVQWLTADDDASPPPTFTEQVEALPFVEEVRTETSRVVGVGSTRALESWVTLSAEDVMSDPQGVAEGLVGVTWGFQQSHWSIDDLPSTAEVRDRGPIAKEPVRWWAEAAAALGEAEPGAALDCRITDVALRCEVAGGEPGRVLGALATVDGTDIEPWLAGASAEEGQEEGFSLTVGGRTFTDATELG